MKISVSHMWLAHLTSAILYSLHDFNLIRNFIHKMKKNELQEK